MRQSRVTNRYAKALLDLAVEQNNLSTCYKDMLMLSSACKENKELELLLKSPIVKTDKKLAILKQLFEDKLDNLSMSFVNIITTKKREALLADIATSFIYLYKAHNKIEAATVTTANPLDEQLKAQVIDFIKNYGQQDVELTEIVDENIIGGAIIRMGDKQLDASISRTIKELKQTFNKNLYIKDF